MNEAVIQGENEIALLEDGALVGYCKLTEQSAQAGDIFWGRVVQCAPGGSGACFVDIGLPENAFCSKMGKVQQGALLPVMVLSGAHDNKPVRVSFAVQIPSTFFVLLSEKGVCNVSGKITAKGARKRLKEQGEKLLAAYSAVPGLIMRTGAVEADWEELSAEASRLGALWERIRRGKYSPGLLYRPDPYQAFLNRLKPLDSIVTDCTDVYEKLRPFYPHIRYRAHGDYSLFAVKNVTSQLASLTGRKVWLPSGGNIVIEYTEALTVIDVNSGKATGSKASPLQVNLEAAKEIMRQLRLRNIGGAIVCDFIGMSDHDSETVLETLKKLAKDDFGKPKVYGFTKLGLAEIGRKRS